MYDNTAVEPQLRRLLDGVIGTPLPLDDDPAARTASLWNLGLTSAGFMRLLADIEDGFGLAWDLDDPADVVSSFDALLTHVAAHATRLPAAEATAAGGSR